MSPHPRRPGRLTTDDWKFSHAEFEVIDQLVGPFTVDMCASSNNAHCPRYFTKATPFSAHDLSGETVWCNAPWRLIGSAIDHYLKCKMKAPTTTSAVFIVPQWDTPWMKTLETSMQLIRSYPKGVNLFSAPGPSSTRVRLGPTPWPVLVFWDPPAGSPKTVRPALGCIPRSESGLVRHFSSLTDISQSTPSPEVDDSSVSSTLSQQVVASISALQQKISPRDSSPSSDGQCCVMCSFHYVG